MNCLQGQCKKRDGEKLGLHTIYSCQSSTTNPSIHENSPVLWVTMVSPCASAVAAIIKSLDPIKFPARRRRACTHAIRRECRRRRHRMEGTDIARRIPRQLDGYLQAWRTGSTPSAVLSGQPPSWRCPGAHSQHIGRGRFGVRSCNDAYVLMQDLTPEVRPYMRAVRWLS